jgi:hypothetical protein
MLEKLHALLRKWTGNLLLAALGISLLAFLALPTATASAQSAAQTEPAGAQQGERGDNFDQRLALWYQREQLAAESMALRLSSAQMIADSAATWIAELQDQGVDTGELEAALGAFNAGRASAQGHLDSANAVLATGEGFDADGNVSDRRQALETLLNAGRSLRDASRELRDATIDFRRVVADFIRDRRGQ